MILTKTSPRGTAAILCSALLTGLVAAPLSAQPVLSGGHVQFTEIDTDGDGLLSRAEVEAHIQARIDAWHTGSDAAWQARVERMVEQLMDHADADGRLDADALRTGLLAMMDTRRSTAGTGTRADRHRRGGMDVRSSWIERMFDRIDSDGDGTITRDEFDAAMAQMGQRRHMRGHHRNMDHGRMDRSDDRKGWRQRGESGTDDSESRIQD